MLNAGTDVEITAGEQRGMRGRVVGISTKGTVTIREAKDSESSGSTIDVEVRVEEVRPVFKVANSVTVKHGVFAGRSGIVEEVDGATIVIRDGDTSQEVS